MTVLCVSLFVLVSWFWLPMLLCHLVSALYSNRTLRVEWIRVKNIKEMDVIERVTNRFCFYVFYIWLRKFCGYCFEV